MTIKKNPLINFVSQGGAYMGSHRMRALIPAQLINVGVENLEAMVSQAASPDASLNIFSKHLDTNGNVFSAATLRQHGKPVMFDICDDHFDKELGEYYTKMCKLATIVTCNTEGMKQRILEIVPNKDVVVIPDAITFPEREPVDYTKLGIGQHMPRLLWFGHALNQAPLYDWLNAIGERKVLCVSNIPVVHPKAAFKTWMPQLVEKVIQDFDIVLVPTQKTEEAKRKSPNRVVDAIMAGKFVITDNWDIYGELEGYIGIIQDLSDIELLIDFWKNNPEEVRQRILVGQEFCKERYGDAAVIDGWLSAFEKAGVIKGFKNVD